ncbi:MAG: MotA/TolQ/ExbB proton channel family protein [Limnobacter sp.]|uniref:MotA/TolQ/ExbB proton channel family protein n=1 Tax=Limnobacter sp. TaxID=2003368 RepID=UPI00391D085C
MWAIVTAAGWPIWPLIFASIIALAIVIERVHALRAEPLFPKNLIEEACKTPALFKDANNLARLKAHSALGSILASGYAAAYAGGAWSEAMDDAAAQVQRNMAKHLDLLSLIASAAPLMGLLGTVVGMIEIFAVQGAASQTPESLASGIAVALYNTAFGLMVAIPALVAYRLLRLRIETLLNRLEVQLEPFEGLARQIAAASSGTRRVSKTRSEEARP